MFWQYKYNSSEINLNIQERGKGDRFLCHRENQKEFGNKVLQIQAIKGQELNQSYGRMRPTKRI